MYGYSEIYEWKYFSKIIYIYNYFVLFVEYIYVILKKYEINICILFFEFFFFLERG